MITIAKLHFRFVTFPIRVTFNLITRKPARSIQSAARQRKMMKNFDARIEQSIAKYSLAS